MLKFFRGNEKLCVFLSGCKCCQSFWVQELGSKVELSVCSKPWQYSCLCSSWERKSPFKEQSLLYLLRCSYYTSVKTSCVSYMSASFLWTQALLPLLVSTPDSEQQSPQRDALMSKLTGTDKRSASNVVLQASAVHFSFALVLLFLLCGKNT